MNAPTLIQMIGATLFGLAVLHTFSTKFFEHLAHTRPRHAGMWHLLAEVEVVFGVWAMVLVLFMGVTGKEEATHYLESRNFTEPMFVFAIMVIAGTRPILQFTDQLVRAIARMFRCKGVSDCTFWCCRSFPCRVLHHGARCHDIGGAYAAG